jgi:hypothetical protein
MSIERVECGGMKGGIDGPSLHRARAQRLGEPLRDELVVRARPALDGVDEAFSERVRFRLGGP